jgi:hypothetical protein
VKEKENENDETVSGSASVETVCNLRLGRLTQNRPPPHRNRPPLFFGEAFSPISFFRFQKPLW